MIFLFFSQLNVDDLMKRLNAMEESMVRFCFSVYSYIYMYDISFCRKKRQDCQMGMGGGDKKNILCTC